MFKIFLGRDEHRQLLAEQVSALSHVVLHL